MKSKKLLVIVVTYNGMKWIPQCIESVRNSSIKADLFIIDNGSKDHTIKYIKSNYPEAHIIESKENLGFGKANNLGFQFAIANNYDYIYLLNQDAWVETDTFNILIETHCSHPSYGVLSPLQMNKSKTKLDENFSRFCSNKMLSDCLCKIKLKEVYETEFVMAAHWLISIECLKTVGFFSPSFYHYGEDCNFIDRLHYFGYKVGISPYSTGIHDREDREDSNEKKQYKYYTDNLIVLSNPNLNNQGFIRLLGRYMFTALKEPKLINLKYFCRIIKNYRNLKTNLKISTIKNAFMK